MAFNKRKVDIEYIANSGIMFENKGRKIMVDGIHTQLVEPYFSTSERIVNAIINGDQPYDKIDVLVFTHHHKEHFDAYNVCEIIKSNRLTHVICTSSVRKLLENSPNFDPIMISQIHEFSIPFGKSMIMRLKDIPFEAISLQHDGKQNEKVENFAFSFELGEKIFMHLGDSAPIVENFEEAGVFDREVDVLIAPFPYLGLRSGREIISKIKPKKLIISHLPNPEMDEGKWIYNCERIHAKFKKQLPDTEFLKRPGEKFVIK